jgi:hypothetical protein
LRPLRASAVIPSFASLCAHLDSSLILPVRPVYVDASPRACCEFAGAFVDRDCLELEFLVDVDGLEDVVRSIEDNERIARDVDLYKEDVSLHKRRTVCRHTIIWRPSHRP